VEPDQSERVSDPLQDDSFAGQHML